MLSVIAIILSIISVILSIVSFVKRCNKSGLQDLSMHKFKIDLSLGNDKHYNYSYFCNEIIQIADLYGCIVLDYEVYSTVSNVVTFNLKCDDKQLMCFMKDMYSRLPKAEILKY